MQNPSIFVGTPAYAGNCQVAWAMSCMELVGACSDAGIPVYFSLVANESLITRARNSIAADFLKTDCTHLLFIDSDHSFRPVDIFKMIQADVDIIGAVCAKKMLNWDQVREAAKLDLDNLELFSGHFATNFKTVDCEFDPEQPVEVERVGTGIMLIKREVLETLKDHTNTYVANNHADLTQDGDTIHEFFATEIVNGLLYSEDFFFCNKWTSLGNKVYAAPWVENSHFGLYEFKGNIIASGLLNSIQHQQN